MIDFKGNHGVKDSDLFDVVDLDGAAKMVIQIDRAIRAIPDFPHEGDVFRDFTTLWKDAASFRLSTMAMYILSRENLDETVNKVVAIESKGWIYGAILADRLDLPLVVARKHGILPAGTATHGYREDDRGFMRIHRDAISKGDRVLLVDDIIITGRSTLAAAHCVESLGGKVTKILALVDLAGKGGKAKLRGNGYDTVTVLTYPGR